MANQPCLRCFARLSISARPTAPAPLAWIGSPTTALRPFSSSASLSRDGKTRTLRLKRQKRVKGYKVPAVGERKALRKRIILSNSNALRVEGLADFPSLEPEASIGKVVALPDATVDALRSLESFQHGQGWAMFNRPSTLFRQDTYDLLQALHDPSQRTAYRRIITGPRGAGKSVFLLQAHTSALQQGWVVIHLPAGIAIANATTAYAPIPKTQPVQYTQPRYTAELLSRIAKANSEVLSRLTVQLSHTDIVAALAPPGTSLLKLTEAGAADVENSWPIFEALWAELTMPNTPEMEPQSPAEQPTSSPGENPSSKDKPAAKPKDERRPRILLSLDGIAAVSRQSSYLAPNMHHVHAFDLKIVDHFMSHLSGAKDLSNGGAILAADSYGTRYPTPTLDLAIRQSEQLANPGQLPDPSDDGPAQELPLYDEVNPFERHDVRVLQTLRKVPVTRLQGFTREEAQTMLEYYARSGMIRARITNAMVAEKWASSGGGIIRELERSSVNTGLL